MSKLFGFILLAVSAWLIPGAQAGTISYSASLGCDNSCLTTFVEWSDFDPGVAFVVPSIFRPRRRLANHCKDFFNKPTLVVQPSRTLSRCSESRRVVRALAMAQTPN
jgi:hypothetical protein